MNPTDKFAKFWAGVASGSMLMPTIYAFGSVARTEGGATHRVDVGPIVPGHVLHIDNEVPGVPGYLGAQPLAASTSTAMTLGMSYVYPTLK